MSSSPSSVLSIRSRAAQQTTMALNIAVLDAYFVFRACGTSEPQAQFQCVDQWDEIHYGVPFWKQEHVCDGDGGWSIVFPINKDAGHLADTSLLPPPFTDTCADYDINNQKYMTPQGHTGVRCKNENILVE